ncbi:MAG: response regulator [Cyanobacteria bacterium CRU_2_1]|nr:response regulator [Cyanobacteria bacterium CRU_2_1]
MYTKELEIQLQFLDEAQEYLGAMEDALSDITNRGIEVDKMSAALRSAHSIKGGAGMMGFRMLSHLAHRLEDFLKVLKVQQNSVKIDAELEGLLLTGVDSLRQVIELVRDALLNGVPGDLRNESSQAIVDPNWLETYVVPIFDRLYDRLGEPATEDFQSILATSERYEIILLLFQTEVEEGLQQMEQWLAACEPCLQDRLTSMAREFAGLGEMLKLTAFTALCQSITQQLTVTERVQEVAQAALQAWRRSQTLVFAGQFDALPNAIAIKSVSILQPAMVDVVPEKAFEPVWADENITGASFNDLESASIFPEESQEDFVCIPVKHLNRLSDLFEELAIENNGLNLNLRQLQTFLQTLNYRVKGLKRSNTRLRDIFDRITLQTNSIVSNFTLNATHVSSKHLTENNIFPVYPISSTAQSTQFDALEMDRYSDLHLLSQDVMEIIAQIQEVTSDIELALNDSDQTAYELNKSTRQLRTKLTQVRMQPSSDAIDRLPKKPCKTPLENKKPVNLKMQTVPTVNNNSSGVSSSPNRSSLPSNVSSLPIAHLKQPPTVLVVDDSINVRRFLTLTLEKAGYQVSQAKDGQEAIEKLTTGLGVHAVICDIEMPRLDGYGFLTRFKSDPVFKRIPVAMLTSRSEDKHRQLAMHLGANAYFSKPYNEQTLLQTLENLVELSPAV